jgi:hypothetical protein
MAKRFGFARRGQNNYSLILSPNYFADSLLIFTLLSSRHGGIFLQFSTLPD